MLKHFLVFIIVLAMAGIVHCHAQSSRIKIDGYDHVTFYLVYPDTMKNMLADGIEDDCRDSVLTFKLHLTFKTDSTITNDSVYYICNQQRIHGHKLSEDFKKIKFTCEGVKYDYADYNFIVPVRLRSRLVVGH